VNKLQACVRHRLRVHGKICFVVPMIILKSSDLCRAAWPLAAICCLGLILFLICATIVLALIPVYLSARGVARAVDDDRCRTNFIRKNATIMLIFSSYRSVLCFIRLGGRRHRRPAARPRHRSCHGNLTNCCTQSFTIFLFFRPKALSLLPTTSSSPLSPPTIMQLHDESVAGKHHYETPDGTSSCPAF
jgi:hypothetical protein